VREQLLFLVSSSEVVDNFSALEHFGSLLYDVYVYIYIYIGCVCVSVRKRECVYVYVYVCERESMCMLSNIVVPYCIMCTCVHVVDVCV